MDGIDDLTVRTIREELEAGATSALDLTEACLERIGRFDDDLRAIITVNDDATGRARELDETFADSGPVGPLHGVPVVLKDNVDTADMPTTGGSVLFADSVPPSDAFLVRRLRQAGAVVVAKANLHELAQRGETASSLGGQTRNPYAPDRTPGGSSGGTGAAVATGMAAVGIGTDTVNSIRSPASACNLVGMRPTRGVLSRDGLIPVSDTQDSAGPITRSVADAAAMLDVMAGYDPADPVTARSHERLPDSYLDALDADALNGARLGVLQSFFGDGDPFEPVTAVIEDALADMRVEGATTVQLDADIDVDDLIDRIDVQSWEFPRGFERYLDTLDDPPVDSFEEYVASDTWHESIQPQIAAAVDRDDPAESLEYHKRLNRRHELSQTIHRLFAEHDLDALVYPHQKRLTAEIGDPQLDRNGFLASGSGHPSITVPAGFSDEGVPVGVEFVARPFEDETLIGLGYAYEQATQHRRPPEEFSDSD